MCVSDKRVCVCVCVCVCVWICDSSTLTCILASGSCLSVVSSVIQLCKVIRELAYKNPDQRDKVSTRTHIDSHTCTHARVRTLRHAFGPLAGLYFPAF